MKQNHNKRKQKKYRVLSRKKLLKRPAVKQQESYSEDLAAADRHMRSIAKE